MLHTADILNDRYRLQRKLGYGGFSEVWHAWDEHDKREVAIKIFLRQDEEGIRLCGQEFVRTNQMKHPRLIRFYDFGVQAGAPFLVMPYFRKGTADTLAGSMDEETFWRLVRDIGSGLHYVHQLRPPVVHNDLKPDNILVAEDGSFVLADFGISTALADRLVRSEKHERREEAMGVSPRGYRAPELFHYRDKPKQDAIKASDIWAFGACLYELVTGDLPFGDQGGFFQKMDFVDVQTPVSELVAAPVPAHFSAALTNLIYQCLDPEPWNRPMAQDMANTAEQQLHLLEQARVHASSATVLDEPLYRQSLMIQQNRKAPAWFWAVSGSVGTVILFLIWQWMSGIGMPDDGIMPGKTEKEIIVERSIRDSIIRDSTRLVRQKEQLVGKEQKRVAQGKQESEKPANAITTSKQVTPPTPEESKQMLFTTLLDKAIAAVRKNGVEYRVLSDIKKNGFNENTCKQLPSLRISNKDAVRDFIRHCKVEYCDSGQTSAILPSPKDTVQEKKNAMRMTKDQKTLMSKVAHKKFYVQVGSFQLTKDANNEKDRLGKLGLRNLTIYPNFKSPLRKHVIIPYRSKAEAQKALPEIEKITQRKCTIFELEDQSK